MAQETRRGTWLLLMAILAADLALLAVGIFGNAWFGLDSRQMLSFVTPLIGLVTFVGFFAVTYAPGTGIERAMRNAIAASITAMYLATVGTVTFFLPRQGSKEGEDTLPKITETMLGSFHTVVLVVMGFYFTSSAAVEGIQRAKTGKVPGERET